MLVETRVPARPLIDAVGSRVVLARRCRVSLSAVEGWEERGLPLYVADRRAIEAGVMPHRVWPGWANLPDKVLG